jgi:hypothetical protein
MKRIAFCLLSIAAATAAFAAKEVERADAYALRFPLQIAANAGLQRLTLPPAALAAVTSPNQWDVRVFNGNGDTVPIAILPLRDETTVASTRRISFYPINATAQQQQALDRLQLRIEERPGQRVVSVDSGGSNTKGAPAPNTVTKVIGALIDQQSITEKLDALIIDADLPTGEPVPLTVSASKDLTNWRTLAQASPVFRFGGEGAPSNLRVPLNNISLDKEYLRITWPTQPAFVLREVKLAFAPTKLPIQRVEIPLTATMSNVGNELNVAVPFSTPLHALLMRPATGNALIPIRVYSRYAKDAPWGLVASSVIYRISSGGNESVSPPIELNGLISRELKIESDRNPSAFTDAMPTVHAIVNPVGIAFVASGSPPFTLAVGKRDASAFALPVSSLIPGYVDGSETKLALANVDVTNAVATAPAAPTALATIKEKVGAPSERSLVLWGVLIAGVLLLGGLAWSMLKQTGKSNEKIAD